MVYYVPTNKIITKTAANSCAAANAHEVHDMATAGNDIPQSSDIQWSSPNNNFQLAWIVWRDFLNSFHNRAVLRINRFRYACFNCIPGRWYPPARE